MSNPRPPFRPTLQRLESRDMPSAATELLLASPPPPPPSELVAPLVSAQDLVLSPPASSGLDENAELATAAEWGFAHALAAESQRWTTLAVQQDHGLAINPCILNTTAKNSGLVESGENAATSSEPEMDFVGLDLADSVLSVAPLEWPHESGILADVCAQAAVSEGQDSAFQNTPSVRQGTLPLGDHVRIGVTGNPSEARDKNTSSSQWYISTTTGSSSSSSSTSGSSSSSKGKPNANTVLEDLSKDAGKGGHRYWLVLFSSAEAKEPDNAIQAKEGHVWLAVVDAKDKKMTVLGFYPKDASNLSYSNPSTDGQFLDDQERRFTVARAFKIRDENAYNRWIKTLDQAKSSPPKYDLASNNCASWVVKMAGLSGVSTYNFKLVSDDPDSTNINTYTPRNVAVYLHAPQKDTRGFGK